MSIRRRVLGAPYSEFPLLVLLLSHATGCTAIVSVDAGVDANLGRDAGAFELDGGDAASSPERDAAVSPDASPMEFDGSAPMDAGPCEMGQARCGDACVDLSRDVGNCGRCENDCGALPNVMVATCESAECVLDGSSCAAGWSDCDGDPDNGCETDLSSSTLHCGRCGEACGAAEACVEGACAPPRVLAIHPPVAVAGQTIVLDGNFPAGDFSVQLPGPPAPTPVTRLGPARASVVVPMATTAGEFALAGSVLPFRRTSHAMGLQRFRREYEQTGYARMWPALSSARVGATAIATRRWLYVVGGSNGGASGVTAIERALINGDGSIGPFGAAGALPTPRLGAAFVSAGSSLYVVGGEGSSSVERASIDETTGTVGGFSAVGASLRETRNDHSAVVIGSSIFVVGGTSRTVERARINSDGTLAPFRVVDGVQTSVVRRRAAVAVLGSWLFVFGGTSDGTTALSSVERAPIRTDGSLGPFEPAGSMRRAREGGAVVHLGRASDGAEQLFLVGGIATTAAGSVERVRIDSTTGGANFEDHDAPLVAARREHAAVVIGNYLYLIGGRDGSGALSTLERASIVRDTSLASAGSFPDGGRGTDGFFVHGEYLYFAMFESRPNVGSPLWRARIAADGTLGAPTMTAVSLPDSGRGGIRRTFAVSGRFVHQLGGIAWRDDLPGEGGLPLSRVLRAPLNDDGTLGAFTSAGSLPEANYGHHPLFARGRLYVLGGCVSTCTPRTSVWTATVATDGSLSSFSDVGVSLTTGRYYGIPLVLGDSVWVVGAMSISGTTTADRAPILASGNLGPFESVAVGATPSDATLRGAVVGSNLVRFHPDEASSIGPGDTLGTFTPFGLGSPAASDVIETTGGINVWLGPSAPNIRYELR